jgi:hypothetical protein
MFSRMTLHHGVVYNWPDSQRNREVLSSMHPDNVTGLSNTGWLGTN